MAVRTTRSGRAIGHCKVTKQYDIIDATDEQFTLFTDRSSCLHWTVFFLTHRSPTRDEITLDLPTIPLVLCMSFNHLFNSQEPRPGWSITFTLPCPWVSFCYHTIPTHVNPYARIAPSYDIVRTKFVLFLCTSPQVSSTSWHTWCVNKRLVPIQRKDIYLPYRLKRWNDFVCRNEAFRV